MDNLKLSICIPTYNFGEFIGETLRSIIDQINDDVEIVVGDGGSTDNTEQIVKAYQSIFPRLVYCKFKKKGGVDLDLAKTVELSKGDYCWLMSADDVLKPGAIARILKEIKFGHDVYLYNRTICDLKLKPKENQYWLSETISDYVYNFSEKAEILDYLNASKSLGALFSYISSIIVRRNEWINIGFDTQFSDTNYAHVFRLLYILTKGDHSLKYIKDSLVLCRGGNDSFLDKGLSNRILIDFDGYRRVQEIFFPDDDLKNALKALMRRAHSCLTLARVKSEVVESFEWDRIKKNLSYYIYNPADLSVIYVLGRSRNLIKILRAIKNYQG